MDRQQAVEREIEIIAEASRRIPDALKAKEPTIPWRDIAGIDNIRGHDDRIVCDPLNWNAVIRHLGPLEAALRRMTELLGPDGMEP